MQGLVLLLYLPNWQMHKRTCLELMFSIFDCGAQRYQPQHPANIQLLNPEQKLPKRERDVKKS